MLITVKATPQPSSKYGDTVCVAGVRLDTEQPRFIRLYPIAFRWLGDNAQFSKYDILELDAGRRYVDTRAESYSPVENSWVKVGHLPAWKARVHVISRLPVSTTCGMIRAARDDGAAPSLGLVYVKGTPSLEFEPHQKWTPEQITKMKARIMRESESLFDDGHVVPEILREPRLIARYRYFCHDADCNGHTSRILDWELTALQARSRGDDAELKREISAKYVDMMFAEKRRPALFLGNLEAPTKRASFSTLGVFYPEAKDSEVALF